MTVRLEEYLKEYEARIREHLTDERLRIEQINEVLGFFCRSLNAILAGGDKGDPKRYWGIDTLWCTEAYQEAGKIFVSGDAYWLEGGKHCNFFEAEILMTERSIYYVFAFGEKGKASTPNLIIESNEAGICVEAEYGAGH